MVNETPRNSRNKLKYDVDSGLFLLKKVLPAGAVFPYDFGFIPSTAGDDGDPMDTLILMDESSYPGVPIRVRLVGAIAAEQTEKGKTIRNDRLLEIANVCRDYQNVQEIEDLDENLLSQIEHFFVSYNRVEGRTFKPIGRPNRAEAQKLLDAGRKRFDQKSKSD